LKTANFAGKVKKIGKKNKGEKFTAYLNRKNKELKDKGENNIFQPFK